jgi:DNA gyrase subunit A
MAPIEEDKSLLVVSERGFGKRTDLEEYRVQTRGGKGLITYRTTEKTGDLAGIALVDDTNDIVIINDTGIIIRLSAAEIPILSRVTQGVTLMRSKDGRVMDIAVVEHEEESTEDADLFAEESLMEESASDLAGEPVLSEDNSGLQSGV